MNFILRVITFIVALLVAGKEVISLGHVLGFSEESSWSAQPSVAGDPWLLENEAEEEADDKDEDVFGFGHSSDLLFSNIRKSNYLAGSIGCRSKFEFLARHTEFYIYVLNLRL
jgi:hypothetical protein